jgi:putative NADPH-quinone reductase
MNVLQIIAHPDITGSSFTGQMAARFRDGATAADHTVTWYNLYHPDIAEVGDHQAHVLNADHICFAYPVWWEMPPAKLVEYLQTVFVKGFAFDLDGDRMKPKFSKLATCLLSMGQQKDYNSSNMAEAMRYCGMHPLFVVADNVGPRLSPELAGAYLDLAYSTGHEI